MPPQKQSAPQTPGLDTNQAAAQLYDLLMPQQSPQAPVTPQSPMGTMFVDTGAGQMAVPVSMNPVSTQDLQKVQAAEAQFPSGPYGASQLGEAQTAAGYRRNYESPYMNPLAQRIGAAGHGRIAGMLDNALLAGSLVKPPVDASGNPIAAGAGYGISSVMNALEGMPQAQMQYRQRLEQMPIAYQQAQAQLQQERAKGVLAEAQGARALGQNMAQVQAMTERGLGAENVRAAQAERADRIKAMTQILDQLLRGHSAENVAGTRAAGGTRNAQIAANSRAAVAAGRAGKNSADTQYYGAQKSYADSLRRIPAATKYKGGSTQYIIDKLRSGMDPVTGQKIPAMGFIEATQAAPHYLDRMQEYDQGVEAAFGDWSALPNDQRRAVPFKAFMARRQATPVQAAPQQTAPQILPPRALAQLQEGHNTSFNNGQVWTLKNGQPVRVR